uniref:Uncharacterized protein n=1 Tax=Zea mays TaxID=4577 RepID=C4J0C3_MAIZE|nr:unknown [Zea mays]
MTDAANSISLGRRSEKRRPGPASRSPREAPLPCKRCSPQSSSACFCPSLPDSEPSQFHLVLELPVCLAYLQKPTMKLQLVSLLSRDCGVQHGNHQASLCLNYQQPKLIHQSAQSSFSSKT